MTVTDVPLLRARGVCVRFEGLMALDDVAMSVAPSTIHAVIGPNGAGKSTLFNVISGIYRPLRGTVALGQVPLVGLRPDQVASRGVGRSFQNIALLPNATVEENLLLGRHHLLRSRVVGGALRTPGARREERAHRARVAEIADVLGLSPFLASPAASLSYGDQKRVDIARAVCLEPRLLLLDEPAAGTSAAEKRHMAALIRAIREALDITVLLVEHDMGLVMSIADRITVLDFGRVIAEGEPASVRADPAVVRAYLGATDHAPHQEEGL